MGEIKSRSALSIPQMGHLSSNLSMSLKYWRANSPQPVQILSTEEFWDDQERLTNEANQAYLRGYHRKGDRLIDMRNRKFASYFGLL